MNTSHLTLSQQAVKLSAELHLLDRLSLAGFAHNEEVKKRRQALNAFQQKEHQRLEKIKRNMAIREAKQKKAEFTQMSQKLPIQAKRKRLMRTKADDAFSLCVRLRANCTCERCGERFPMNAMKHLHCSHNYSREYKQVRFHPDNAIALCKDCHRWFAWSKAESTAWKNEHLGAEKLRRVFQALQTAPPEISKEEEKRIAAYYRIVARYLASERERGNTDYLDFQPYRPFYLYCKGN